MKLGAGLVGILLVTATLPAGAGERMILKVSPAVAFAPANLTVRAFVEADADNRAIAVIAESDEERRRQAQARIRREQRLIRKRALEQAVSERP